MYNKLYLDTGSGEVELNTSALAGEIIFGDGFSINGRRKEGEYFSTEDLSGRVGFIRGAYATLEALSIDTEFTLVMRSATTGDLRWMGSATYLDGEWLEDQCRVNFKFDTLDDYKLIEEGRAKKFNLVDLGAQLVSVSYTKRAILQVYLAGHDLIANVFGSGVNEEQETTGPETDDAVLTGDYHFQLSQEYLYVTGTQNSPTPDVSGFYDINTLVRLDGVYRFDIVSPIPAIVEVATSTNVYLKNNLLLPNWSDDPFSVGDRTKWGSLSGGPMVEAFQVRIYSRLLTNQETIGASPTLLLNNPDIVDQNSYTRALPYDINGLVEISEVVQTDPTNFGTVISTAGNNPGEYFVRPADLAGEQYQPINQFSWEAFSLWVAMDGALRTAQSQGSEPVTNRNSYRLSDAINVVLNAIGTTVDHQALSIYSDFFYGLANPIKTNGTIPILSVKNDVIVGNYDTAARKAEVSLNDLLLLLKVHWRVFYFVKDERFMLEHIDFHERGGSYTADNVGADFTTLLNNENLRPWSYASNTITYDKSILAERMEFGWMDDVSAAFEGFPIQMLSPYVQKGNIEQLEVSRVTSDLDFIISQPGSISKQGFVITECTQLTSSSYEVPLVSFTVDGTFYTLQNGYCSFLYIHEQYYLYRLPGSEANLNNTDRSGISTLRIKEQTIARVPVTLPDLNSLVTTGQGNGLIDEYDESVLNGILVNLKLKHGL